MTTAFKMKATTGGGDYTPVPSGTHPAVLVGLFDIGTQDETFQGQPVDPKRKVMLVWEIEADGKRQFIGRDYTRSFNEKSNLRQLVVKWRGKDFGPDEEFDLEKLLGKACLLSVSHKDAKSSGNTYARVDGAAAMVKGMEPIKPSVQTISWSVEGAEPVPDAAWIPYLRGKPLHEVVDECHEWKGGSPAGGNGTPAAEGSANSDADEIPF